MPVDVMVSEAKVGTLQRNVIERVWPRCDCTDCGCEATKIRKTDGAEDDTNLDLARADSMSCSKMLLFVVDDDCANGVEAYQALLRPHMVVPVKPGLLGVECSGIGIDEVCTRLKAHHPIFLPEHHRVISVGISDGPFRDSVPVHRTSRHLRVLLERSEGNGHAKYATLPAIEHAKTLSLPLAKVRLLENRPALPHGTGGKRRAIVLHCPLMKCTSCSSKIYKNLKKKGFVPGTDCYVSIPDKEVVCLVPENDNSKEFQTMLEVLLASIDLPTEHRTQPCKKATLAVSGMTCGSCAAVIKKAVSIEGIEIDVSKGLLHGVPSNRVEDAIAAIKGANEKYGASISEFNRVEEACPTVVDTAVTVWERRLEAALFAKDVSPTLPPTTPEGATVIDMVPTIQSMLMVRGMTCVSCVSRIEDHLNDIPGIESVSVALATEMAKVMHKESLSADIIAAELTSMGYPSSVLEKSTDAQLSKQISKEEDKVQLWNAATSSLLLSSPLVIMMLLGQHVSLFMWLMTYHVYKHVTAAVVLQLVLATPVVYLYGAPFFKRAKQALAHSTATMDVLVALGVGTAYASGWIFVLFDIGTPAADTAAVLVSFMLLGKYFECVAKGRTAEELKSLLELRPSTALLVSSVGAEPSEVPAESIQKGDMVRVTAGGKVPIDGEIVHGTIEVDQSMITGESIPVVKEVKDAVTGGTICVNGVGYVRATHVGTESTLSQIVRLINDAQASKAPVQQVADRVARYFVPIVVLIAFSSFTVWFLLGIFNVYPAVWRGDKSPFSFALTFLLSSLVVACPCAMGLATPTAVMVSTGVGAKLGVFIKGGETLEAAAKVKAVLFDKTGTLTTGKVMVRENRFFGKPAEREATLAMVAAVESGSQHPVATAVLGFCNTAKPPVPTEHHTTPGRGVQCIVNGKKVRAGQSAWVLKEAHSEEASAVVNRWHAAGMTVVMCSVDGKVMWAFGLRDTLKPEAPGIVRYLQKNNIKVCIVTGDNRSAALAVAKKVGVNEEDLYAEVLPGDKAAAVNRVRGEEGVVSFVGDGINDAPALAAADIGIALGSGTSVAIDSADAVLTRSDLTDVASLIALSATTLRRIKLNFVWAFGYNVLALPVAAGLTFPITGQLPPILGGIAMIFSSLLVLTSSLLLRHFKPPVIEPVTELLSTPVPSYGSF
eukprot:TRINITY_DN24628_c0_g1_i1.p1 TRINITY_DN24628_c0_g1~~TRINITY_DN24628_c0_g1_i1.p1  ORF type:complete len:1187 (+),score=304.49 TRINITY_DN24628_c0_g1_i1:53-3562(+)